MKSLGATLEAMLIIGGASAGENLPEVLADVARAEKPDLYPGYGYGFWTNYLQMKRSAQSVEVTVKGVRRLLENSRSI